MHLQEDDEVWYDSELMWDSGSKQLGIGGTSGMSGVKVNVEGVLRVGDGLVVGNETLALNEYVKRNELAKDKRKL